MREIRNIFGMKETITTRVLTFKIDNEAGYKTFILFANKLLSNSRRIDICIHSRKNYEWRIIPNKDDVIKVIVTKYKFEREEQKKWKHIKEDADAMP